MSEKTDVTMEKPFIVDDGTAAFDRIITSQPNPILLNPTRIIYENQAGNTSIIALARANSYHQTILLTIAQAYQSQWFQSLTKISQCNYYDMARNFFNWIKDSDYETTEENRYQCLKDFEAHRMNNDAIKISPLIVLRVILKQGMSTSLLSENEYHYIKTLLKLSKPVKAPEAVPYTLSGWFDLPWLRPILGEQRYLLLESPRRLFTSFRVTIAETLSYLLEIRTQWQQQPSIIWEPTSKVRWYYHWNCKMLRHFGLFDTSGEPADEFTKFLLLDLVRPSMHATLKEFVAKYGVQSLGSKLQRQNRQFLPWKKPIYFHPDFKNAFSNLEELLMAWLVACEAVQPTDITKLKTTDYSCEYNRSGRLIAMQCSYFKGRAGKVHKPAMLMASDCWTMAQYEYLRLLPESSLLFRSNVLRATNMQSFGRTNNSNSMPTLLFKTWQQPCLQSRIRVSMKSLQVQSIFLEAALALTHASESISCFTRRTKASRKDYRNTLLRPLPTYLLSLTHIKTTAVHANSDQYRDSDLINHHSHTSATEKHAYLTDANKDFVNRAGRVTRLVLHDLQNVIYQPSITELAQNVNSFELRSQVTEATGSNNAQIYTISQPIDRFDSDDKILIPDSIEQALLFIHTLTQAETKYTELLRLRPDWVEKTLLVQVEWMSRTLQKMRSEAEGRKQYANLSPFLPPLFDHLLETHE